jgi:hypothetical protein
MPRAKPQRSIGDVLFHPDFQAAWVSLDGFNYTAKSGQIGAQEDFFSFPLNLT